MKFISIAALMMTLVTGCFSSGGTSKIPDSISSLDFAVMQHYGSPLGEGVTLSKFISTFQNTVGPSAKITWKTGINDTYTMLFERFDDATRVKHSMAWVFSKMEKKAVVTRLVIDGEEISSFQLGVAMNQFTYPIYMAIGEAEKSSARKPAAK